MKNRCHFVIALLLATNSLMINGSVLANEPEHAAEHESGHGGKSAVTLFLGGTEVHDVWEPTLGLEYTYHINHLWGVFGLVERSDREQDTTLVIAGLGLHPYKELVLVAVILPGPKRRLVRL